MAGQLDTVLPQPASRLAYQPDRSTLDQSAYMGASDTLRMLWYNIASPK